MDKQIKTMLLSDVLHIIGLQVYDRKQHHKEQEKLNKQRLLGFDSSKKGKDEGKPPPLSLSPVKAASPERSKRLAEYFDQLSDEDYDVLADLEEEHTRRGHFTRIFPTAANVDTYAKYFETQRHANTVIWNYLKLGAPLYVLKNHFK